MRTLTVALALSAAPAIALAGPAALMTNSTPESAAAKIGALCKDRGFGVREASSTDVTCQSGGIQGSSPELHADGQLKDVDDRGVAQIMLRFVVVAQGEGAFIKERSSVVMNLNGTIHEFEARFNMARMINGRIEEFYKTLGATAATKSGAGSEK